MDPMQFIRQEDIDAFKDYVKGGTELIGHAPPGHVRLEITHSVLGGSTGKHTNMFKNFDLNATIFEVKELIHLHVGTSPEFMKLILRDRQGNDQAMMLEESLKLGFFNPQHGWQIFCEDRDPMKTIAKFQDIRNLREEDKFKLTEEQYNARPNTVRAWLRENPEKAAEIRARRGEGFVREEESGKELVDAMKIGDRCEVALTAGGKERGEIKWIGKLEGKLGYYVGVHFDLPMGKNNGSFQGTQHFECGEGYGIFTLPEKVEVGDFPEEDLLASDSE